MAKFTEWSGMDVAYSRARTLLEIWAEEIRPFVLRPKKRGVYPGHITVHKIPCSDGSKSSSYIAYTEDMRVLQDALRVGDEAVIKRYILDNIDKILGRKKSVKV